MTNDDIGPTNRPTNLEIVLYLQIQEQERHTHRMQHTVRYSTVLET